MTMLPQPPPNAVAPPPSEAALLSRRKLKWLVIVGGLSIIGLMVWVTPFVLNQRRRAMQTYAVSNARQIGMCLFEFESEYGSFPCPSTIAAVRAKSGTSLTLGTKTSNDFFRQLIASGISPAENYFYANIAGSRKPDEAMGPLHTLEAGECGYTYLLGASSRSNLSRPLAVTPMVPGTDRFDPKRFDGRAVILKMDHRRPTGRPDLEWKSGLVLS